MKIIDLINKIANGEEVPKFWWNGCIHEVEKEYETNKYSIFDTYCKKYKRIELEDLNDEIKFLEEEKKIPEKLKWNEKSQHNVVTDNTKKTLEHLLSRSEQLKKSINQIVDYLDYLKSKGE
jgi:hypothetical protein